MRIYRRAEFLKLPSGTLYAKGKQWTFGDLSVKLDSIDGIDWFYASPLWIDSNNDADQLSKLEQMLENGASVPMDDGFTRDEMFDEADIFLVLEREDLHKLRAMVDAAILVGRSPS